MCYSGIQRKSKKMHQGHKITNYVKHCAKSVKMRTENRLSITFGNMEIICDLNTSSFDEV